VDKMVLIAVSNIEKDDIIEDVLDQDIAHTDELINYELVEESTEDVSNGDSMPLVRKIILNSKGFDSDYLKFEEEVLNDLQKNLKSNGAMIGSGTIDSARATLDTIRNLHRFTQDNELNEETIGKAFSSAFGIDSDIGTKSLLLCYCFLKNKLNKSEQKYNEWAKEEYYKEIGNSFIIDEVNTLNTYHNMKNEIFFNIIDKYGKISSSSSDELSTI
jgi:hypothetical protein